MITSIKIRNAATFNDEGQKIDNLKKINFFYGTNGSGKTTISRVLANMKDYPESKIQWGDSQSEKIIVYNQDFRKRNFSSCSDIPGIYTIGEGSINIENKIKELSDEYTRKNEEKSKILNGRDESNLDEYCKDELNACKKKHEDEVWKLKEIVNGNEMESLLKGYKGSKSKLFQKVIEWTKKKAKEEKKEKGQNSKKILTKKEICQYLTADKALISEISKLSHEILNNIEKDSVFNEPIVGKSDLPISKLIEKLGNSEWVLKGKSFIEKSNNKCPFCQQDLPLGFVEALGNYFDQSYSEKMNKIQEFNDSYETESTKILEQIDKFGFQEESPYNEYIDQEKLEILRNEISSAFQRNKDKISTKLKNPTNVIELEETLGLINKINDLIDNANKKISEFNKGIKNLQNIEDIDAAFWDYVVDYFQKDIDAYFNEEKEIKGKYHSLGEQLKKIKSELDNIVKERKSLEKQRVSIKPTVDKINHVLKSFGFSNFSIRAVDEKSGYQIVRPDGSAVEETLSEGESNFITFLYFYFLLEGSLYQSSNPGKKVIVIDDPVSSLDSHVLYIVCTLLSKLCEEKILDSNSNFTQLMIFTHNVYFYNEVVNNIIRLVKKGDKRKNIFSYFIIRKNNNISTVEYYKYSPVKTTYRMLWDVVRKAVNNISQVDRIFLLNIMRRILEYYFKTLGGFDNLEIYEKMKGEERYICRSLLVVENSQSHGFIDDTVNSTPDEETLREYLNVFKKIFQESGNIKHYDMMMGVGKD